MNVMKAAVDAAYERGRREGLAEVAQIKSELKRAKARIHELRQELADVDRWLEDNYQE